MSISDNLQGILKNVLPGVKLVAISKTNPVENILQAYNVGQMAFGENKVQELVPKYQLLPKDIEWHMVGHLQTNKIKYIAPFVHWIHSIDSLMLLQEVNKQAYKYNRSINCLLQVHIAAEESKFGLNDEELIDLVRSPILKDLTNIQLKGLMGMATFTENELQIRNEFHKLSELLFKVQTIAGNNLPEFKELSMGMSSDYLIAIEEGSTLIRIGSKIFGERHY